jgi:hypothetical protein
MHFMIGTVAWGILFAVVVPYLPGSPIVRGMLFGDTNAGRIAALVASTQ